MLERNRGEMTAHAYVCRWRTACIASTQQSKGDKKRARHRAACRPHVRTIHIQNTKSYKRCNEIPSTQNLQKKRGHRNIHERAKQSLDVHGNPNNNTTQTTCDRVGRYLTLMKSDQLFVNRARKPSLSLSLSPPLSPPDPSTPLCSPTTARDYPPINLCRHSPFTQPTRPRTFTLQLELSYRLKVYTLAAGHDYNVGILSTRGMKIQTATERAG